MPDAISGYRRATERHGKEPDLMRPRLIFAAVLGLGVVTAAPADALTVYVSNEKDNTISVIDGETMKVTATVPVG